MFKLPALVALASLAVALPAQAQTLIGPRLTVSVPSGSVCSVSAESITPGKDASELRFSFRNNGTTNIQFTLRLTITGTTRDGGSVTRTFPDVTSRVHTIGEGQIGITGINPPLPTMMLTSATANLVTCGSAALNRPMAVM
ncbi:MAG: hypothetical protein K5Q68_23120 [Roseococcus sp.]|nr:hypothetical protein [Roseococcus sp.]